MNAAATAPVKSIFAEGAETVKRKFWQAQPFPHYYLDNFLGDERFQRLTESSRQKDDKPEFTFTTALEKNKTTFANDSLDAESKALVESITNAEFLQELTELTSIPEIVPLTEYKNHDFRFYHKMVDGGYLGSHVDHSAVLNQERVHFLNCIYYGPERWNSSWGGETVLFDKWGFNPVAKVECRPNRLLIFLHTSQSFHGVSRITGSTNPRLTMYMDFYAKVQDLQRLNEQSTFCGSAYEARFWQHPTTFVPLSVRHAHRYLPGYLKYLMRRDF
jgi:Rps23 Pro-64 3,4-dihydroxylase Tpa1-like proline 4-hydroxylase